MDPRLREGGLYVRDERPFAGKRPPAGAARRRDRPQELPVAGSDAGGSRAAALYSLIETAKLNAVNPQHYLADVLGRIADHPARHIAELLPWNWQPLDLTRSAA